MTIQPTFNLFDTTALHPSDLSAGAIVYYADHHCVSNKYLHALQVCKVMVSTDRSFLLDNGRKFNPETGTEITKSNGGFLYPYTPTTRAMVQDAQSKLFLVNEVLSIDFNALTTQQLSLIKDVARGAFTQVTMSSPCGGGCGDSKTTVEAQPIITNIRDLIGPTVEVAGIDVDISQPEVTATIAFNDATYELTPSEVDALHEADDEDDNYDDEEDTDEL